MSSQRIVPKQNILHNKVERRVAKSAAALLLEARIGEQFELIVTGASEKAPGSGCSTSRLKGN